MCPKFGLRHNIFFLQKMFLNLFIFLKSKKIILGKKLSYFKPEMGLMRWTPHVDLFFQKSKSKILREKIHLLPFQPTFYDLSLPTLRIIFKCLKRRFFAFFSRKKLKIIDVIVILGEILLVELKLKFVAFCHTQIGQFLSKLVKMMSFFGLK